MHTDDPDTTKNYNTIDASAGFFIPKIKMEEPLQSQNRYFLSCLEKGESPLSDGTIGIDVVKILSAITQSLALAGQPVAVE